MQQQPQQFTPWFLHTFPRIPDYLEQFPFPQVTA